MKENKVLSVIYGIALFVALIGAIGLFYNAIELLNNTSLGYTYGNVSYLYAAFTDFQKPVAITLLVSSIFAIAGVVGGTGYIFSKKRVYKIVFLSCIAIAVIAVLASLIAVCSVWNGYLSDKYNIDGANLIYGQINTTCFAMYSASMSSIIQNLICFAVILVLVFFDFVKSVIEKRKNKVSENSSVEELQAGLNASEKE